MLSKFLYRAVLTLIVSSLAATEPIVAQEEIIPSAEDSISLTADSLFSAKNYIAALPYYDKLIQVYPQDPIFSYKAGICRVTSTRDVNGAIENLKKASTQEVPNLVYFYLGEAYLLNYQFDDAISYYRRFTINGGDQEVPRNYVEQQVSKCENGTFMLKYIYQPKVIVRERVTYSNFYQYINTQSSKGTFVPKPDDLMTNTDKSKGDSSLIFYPRNPVQGDRIFYSSYGSNTSHGKDIYVIERMKDGFWSKPQPLGNSINTPFDEDYPYMSSDGYTLFFASKGHYSMGGFDIYRSSYNSSNKQWSAPENLGFPFSSTFDDFLYVPNDDETQACFVTNRNVEPSGIDVVLVEIEENPIRKTITSLEVLHNIAQLNPLNTSPSDLSSQVKPEINKTTKPQKTGTTSFSAVENDPEYVRVLAKGFAEQMKADSARTKLELLRNKFDVITTAEERKALESQVVKVENTLLEAQRNADGYFAQASQIEQEYLTGKRKPAEMSTFTASSDKIEYLYQAQFASTVFQTDELKSLEKTEKIAPQIENLRKEINSIKIIQSKASETDSAELVLQVQNEFLEKVKVFNSIAMEHFKLKKQLYRECVSVAMVKRGSSENIDVKNEIDRADKHFRSATAIRNNATEDARIESEYDAILLDELGVLRLELAFSKLWGIKLFEQEITSKLFRLEQSIFGKPLVSASLQQQRNEELSPTNGEIVQPTLTPTEVDVDAEPILFKPDEEPPFQVLEKSPYDSKNPIPQHLPLPQGVVYKIQLAAFSNPVSISYFKGMCPLFKEPVSGGKVTKYYTGLFKSITDAQKALPIVRSKGFKDAFIAAWHNGRSVQLSRAEVLEKEETSTPVSNIDIQIQGNEKNFYLVQIGTFKGRLPDDISQTVRALAPGKDITRKPDGQGGFIYSLSSFISVDEATRVKDNLITSGLINASVISVELEN